MVNINDIYAKAINLWRSNNFIEAKNNFKKVLKKQPFNSEVLSYIGILDLQLKNFKEGIFSLKRANTISPNNKNIITNLSNGLLDYANELHNKNLFSQAIDVLEESIKFLPKNEAAYLNLMRLYIHEKKYLKVKEKYECLKRINPKNENMYFLYANSLFDQRDFQTANDLYGEAILLKPDFIECHFHQALCYEFIGNTRRALEKYDDCSKINPNYALALFNKSQLLLASNNFKEGWVLYRYRWKSKKNIDRYLFDPLKELNKSNFINNKILVWAEQGIGDQILFSSLLDDFKSMTRELIVSLDERLIPIYKRSYQDIKFVSLKEALAQNYDYHCPLGNLGSFTRTNLDDFKKQKKQFLISDKQKNKYYLELIQTKKPICGISWTSKNEFYGDSKSISIDDIGEYLVNEKTKYVNLEYVDDKVQIETAIKKYNIDIYNAYEVDKYNDLDSLASLISCCDYIVTISNVTAHFAGALGIKTILLVPYSYGKLWYWSDEIESKWYPSIKIFRQIKPSNWAETLDELRKNLSNFL